MRIRHIGEFSDILAGYAYASQLSSSDWAWEFLRRNRRFQANAMAQVPDVSSEAADARTTRLILMRRDRLAETWGLIFFPDPDLSARVADVFWSDRAFPRKIAILGRERATDEPDELFDVGLRTGRVTHLTDARQREHLLIRAGASALQVRYRGLPLFAGRAVKLDVSLSGISQASRQAQILAQAGHVFGHGETGAPRLTQQALRLRNALIALDAHDAGLTYRDTALILYDHQRVAHAWQSGSTAMKSEMVRLLAKGQRLRAGGYFRLLQGRLPANGRQAGCAQC